MNIEFDPSLPKTEIRRQFLKSLAAASAAAMAVREPRLLLGADREPIDHPRPTADACILLWMGGGMAAPDTFDPKRYVPFEVGVPVKDVESTFPQIDTVVDNIKITQGLENIAQVMDRGTLIRSHVLPDLGSISRWSERTRCTPTRLQPACVLCKVRWPPKMLTYCGMHAEESSL